MVTFSAELDFHSSRGWLLMPRSQRDRILYGVRGDLHHLVVCDLLYLRGSEEAVKKIKICVAQKSCDSVRADAIFPLEGHFVDMTMETIYAGF